MRYILKHLRLPKWIYKYLGALVILLVTLYPKFPLFNISGAFVAIRFEDLVLILVGVVVFISLSQNIKYYTKNKIVKVMVLYLSIAFISLLSSAFITKTIDLKIGFFHWLRRVEYFLPFVLGLEIIRKNINFSFFFKLILVVVFLAFIYGYGQKNFYWPMIVTQNQEYSRGIALRYVPGGHINSTFAGHYDLATFLVMVLPIIITAFFIFASFIDKLIIFTAYLASMWLLVNAASRISIFSYFFSVSLALLLVKKYKAIIPIVLLSLVFALYSSNLLLRYSRLIEVLKESFSYNVNLVGKVYAESEINLKRNVFTPTPTPTPVLEDRSSNIRLNVEWPRAVRAFIKNPLLGTGYSSITLATDNDFLRALGETGILGFLSFILVFLRLILEFLKRIPFEKFLAKEELAFVAGLFGGLSGIFINAFFIDVFEASKFAIVFWFFIGMSQGLLSTEKGEY